jgi:hypothetical protein
LLGIGGAGHARSYGSVDVSPGCNQPTFRERIERRRATSF